MSNLLPRIESTGTGGIVLVDEGKGADFYAHRTDLGAEQEDAFGLPESLSVLLYSLLGFDATTATGLRLIAEYAAAVHNRGFLEGRKAEREDREKVPTADRSTEQADRLGEMTEGR